MGAVVACSIVRPPRLGAADGPAQGAGGHDGNPFGRNSDVRSMIFPEPQEVSASDDDFAVDTRVRLLLPPDASQEDTFLAQSLAHDVSDRFAVGLKCERAATSSGDQPMILMGTLDNPLVRQHCDQHALTVAVSDLPAEGYILRVTRDAVVIAGKDPRGAFYGYQSLRCLLFNDGDGLSVRGAVIRDWPDKPFRGIYLFLPGRANIAFFKRFVRDFMALHKFNTIILEMNGCMRLDRHPELNYGTVRFARDVNYAARNYPPGPMHDMEQNSSHQDVADGEILEKDEVAELVAWARSHHLEVIPQLPSFTHSYYLLAEHRDLAAVPEDKWPDIYCPTRPETYKLVLDVYDEYIEVFQPKSIHIGHDELFLPIDASATCRDTDIGELYGRDIRTIHDHLASRGIKTQFWGDMLLQQVRGAGPQSKRAPDGWAYKAPGGMTAEQVERLIPKDCLIYNWFWADEPGAKKTAELNESYLDKMGFQQVFGNFEPTIENYEARKKRTSILGGAPSSWAATTEINLGKDLLAEFLGCSHILWTGHVMPARELSAKVQAMMPQERMRLSGVTPPSKTESSIVSVNLASCLNSDAVVPALGLDLSGMPSEPVHYGKVVFDLQTSQRRRAIVVGSEGQEGTTLPKAVIGIPIGEAPTSLIFLHASARAARNRESFRLIWDEQDTADLLGWYEVTYEDDFKITVPIRYGVHLCAWDWDQRTSFKEYCYGADAVSLGGSAKGAITFFAYEWINPRLGKVIREVSLKGSKNFRGGSDDFTNDAGPVIASNAVILAAVSLVRKRS